jgi:hypothetical protein
VFWIDSLACMLQLMPADSHSPEPHPMTRRQIIIVQQTDSEFSATVCDPMMMATTSNHRTRITSITGNRRVQSIRPGPGVVTHPASHDSVMMNPSSSRPSHDHFKACPARGPGPMTRIRRVQEN